MKKRVLLLLGFVVFGCGAAQAAPPQETGCAYCHLLTDDAGPEAGR